MKRWLALFLLPIAAGAQTLGYKPRPYGAFLSTDGVNWSALTSGLSGPVLGYTPSPIALYCNPSSDGVTWTPCTFSGSGSTLPTATAANQYLSSTGAGTTYTATQFPLSAGVLATDGNGLPYAAPVAGGGAAFVTGPNSGTTPGDFVSYSGTGGSIGDSGILYSSVAPKASPVFTGNVGVNNTNARFQLDDAGSFQSAVTGPTAAITTTATLTATATTIPISSSTGLPAGGGLFIIGAYTGTSEWVLCTGAASNNLTGCTRGVYAGGTGLAQSGTGVPVQWVDYVQSENASITGTAAPYLFHVYGNATYHVFPTALSATFLAGNVVTNQFNLGGSGFDYYIQGTSFFTNIQFGTGGIAITARNNNQTLLVGDGASQSASAAVWQVGGSGSTLFAGTGTTSVPFSRITWGTAASITNYSTSGTGLGIDAPSGFAGNLVDFHVGTNSVFSVSAAGNVTTPLIVTAGTAPTMAAGAAAGTSPSCTTTSGHNVSGVLTCTTGTATTATATLATITFNGTLATAPQGCQLFPRNAATALAATMVYTTAPTTTTWTIGVGGTALTASTAYSWSYQCI